MSEPSKLTKLEFESITDAWVERLRDGMSRAGCNDSFPSEFPLAVCTRYPSDFQVLEAWRRYREEHWPR